MKISAETLSSSPPLITRKRIRGPQRLFHAPSPPFEIPLPSTNEFNVIPTLARSITRLRFVFAFFLPKRNIEEGESLSALLICVELTESRNCSFAARRPRSSNFPFYGDYSSIACDRIVKETSQGVIRSMEENRWRNR